MVGMLRDEFKLPAFWIKAAKGHEFNPDDVKAFLKECVPTSFQDPVESHIVLICKDEKSVARAKRARARATHSTHYPDDVLLVNLQSWYDIWIRPCAGNEDPLGLIQLLTWMFSEYKITIEEE